MRHQIKISSFASSGVARWMPPAIFAWGTACVSLFGQGCGQSPDDQKPASVVDLAAEGALRVVEGCQAQARDCFANGDAIACEEQLRSCLSGLVADAGGPPPHPERDGSTPPPRPERDGGGPDDDPPSDGGKPARDGSPPSDPGSPDAGRRELPDAAKGALTDPVGNDGGPATLACVNALRACLASAAKPSTCAEQSRVCFSGARDGG